MVSSVRKCVLYHTGLKIFLSSIYALRTRTILSRPLFKIFDVAPRDVYSAVYLRKVDYQRIGLITTLAGLSLSRFRLRWGLTGVDLESRASMRPLSLFEESLGSNDNRCGWW